MRPLIVHHSAYVADLPPGHRFPMPKYALLFRRLQALGLAPEALVHRPEPASAATLQGAHTPAYVSAVLARRLSAEAVRRLGLPLSESVVRRARASAGGTLLAARLALRHGLACSTAGGSHHAFAGAGAGFCVFNDVAIAARALLAEGAARRILVIDLDVHQGDGTAAMLADEPRVATLSIHCRTNFPARKQQSTRDVALDPDTGDLDYLAVARLAVNGALDSLAPDFVFYNAGVDPHRDDRLGRLAMSDKGIAEREALVLDACRKRGLPLAVVIGGGYAETIETVAARHAILHQVAADLPDW